MSRVNSLDPPPLDAGRDDLAMSLLREFGWPFRGETPLRVA